MPELGELRNDEPIRDALAELDDTGAFYRLNDKDVLLFGDDVDDQLVAGTRLGWLDATADTAEQAVRLDRFVADVRGAGFQRTVLAGMGGSSLAPEVFARVGGGRGGLPLDVLDSTHPDAVRAVLDTDLSQTLVLVSSKSGSTEETRAFAAAAAAQTKDLGQLVAITDPESELAIAAGAEGYRDVILADPDIGGRYSALSVFGMVPAALLGYDARALWARADALLGAGPGAEVSTGTAARAGIHPAVALAAYIGGMARSGRDKLTLLTAPGIESFGDWAEQLVAESLGKRGTGVVPVVGEPVGPPQVYGEDRAFVELRLAGARAPGAEALDAAGRPVLALDLADAADLGAQFMLWEMAVALAAVLLDVNPFDEPNVAESKANTRGVLDRSGALPPPEDGDVRALLDSVQPGDYVSLQAYLPPTAAVHDALRTLQGSIRDRLSVAVTAGVGPRFLHSTGQLHKGGPDSIVALQIVDAGLWREQGDRVAIPGRPYDFATLIRAQAVGDLQSLRDHDRRVAQVGVGGPGGLADLVDRVSAAL